MSRLSSIRGEGRWRAVSLGLLLLGLLAGAFFLGRRSSGPENGEAVVQAHDHEGHGHEGHGGEGEEHGGIHFSPDALAQAGIRVEPVAVQSIRSQLQVTGGVEPNIAGLVKITSRVTGKITALRASIGDTVRAGQVLATMSSSELAEAQARHRQAVARVAAAQANLRRQRQLAGFGEFGLHKVQEARGNFNAAQGDVNEAQAEIRAARNGVAESEAALAAARSEEASVQSDLVATEAALSQAHAQARVAQSRFRRQEALLKEELTSRQEWEQAQADLQKATSDVVAAQAAISSVQAKQSTAHARAHQALSVIETHQARVRQAEAKLAAARQRLEIARESRDREEKVFRSGVYASKEVAEAEAALRHAMIDRTAAADAVRLLGGVPGGGSTVGVASPLAGRVTERRVSIGETVTPERSVFTVLNLKTVWVQLNVYPRDLRAVAVGLPVTVTTDAVPGREFIGTVTYVGDVVDERTRTVKVRCAIPNPGGTLKPDMFVRGRIGTSERQRGIALPRDAVQTLEGKTVVFVEGSHAGHFDTREVRTAGTVDGRTVITAGIDAGERVVTRGAFMVKAQAMKSELGHKH